MMHESNIQAVSGVQGWSSPCSFSEYTIFCVGNDMYREVAFRAWAAEQGIGFRSLIGCYKGITERSFIINRIDYDIVSEWFANEETVLHLSPLFRDGRLYGMREATLCRPDGSAEPQKLGWFRDVTKDCAMKQDAWTFDPTSETYWVADRRN